MGFSEAIPWDWSLPIPEDVVSIQELGQLIVPPYNYWSDVILPMESGSFCNCKSVRYNSVNPERVQTSSTTSVLQHTASILPSLVAVSREHSTHCESSSNLTMTASKHPVVAFEQSLYIWTLFRIVGGSHCVTGPIFLSDRLIGLPAAQPLCIYPDIVIAKANDSTFEPFLEDRYRLTFEPSLKCLQEWQRDRTNLTIFRVVLTKRASGCVQWWWWTGDTRHNHTATSSSKSGGSSKSSRSKTHWRVINDEAFQMLKLLDKAQIVSCTIDLIRSIKRLIRTTDHAALAQLVRQDLMTTQRWENPSWP